MTDRQVVLTRQKLMEGKSQQAAAAASGMSERSVRHWRQGPLPSEKKTSRRQRTRPDPFAGVWAEDIEPLLRTDIEGVLSAPTILEWLDGRHPGTVRQVASAHVAASDAGLARASRPRS